MSTEISKLSTNIRTLLIQSKKIESDATDAEVEQAVAELLSVDVDSKAASKPEQSDKPESKPVETVSKAEHDALKGEVETLKQSVSNMQNDLKAVKSDVQTLGKRPKLDSADGEKDVTSEIKKKSDTPIWDNLKKQMGI